MAADNRSVQTEDIITQRELQEAYIAEAFAHPVMSSLLRRLQEGASVERTGQESDIELSLPTRVGEQCFRPVRELGDGSALLEDAFEKIGQAMTALLPNDHQPTNLNRAQVILILNDAANTIQRLTRQSIRQRILHMEAEGDFSALRGTAESCWQLQVGLFRMRWAAICFRVGWTSIGRGILGSIRNRIDRATKTIKSF